MYENKTHPHPLPPQQQQPTKKNYVRLTKTISVGAICAQSEQFNHITYPNTAGMQFTLCQRAAILRNYRDNVLMCQHSHPTKPGGVRVSFGYINLAVNVV